ncbi:transcription factor bHLH110-like isoform X1 [Malus sylvestris]|uniref:transcription factor bHLH110-like isoform X1 n=1 Tax=Malus sylvestris TaxID=3752 RepID=UPI0021ABB831|nr:transcription factor bHLH110-like isoform X1 [Malus sylvestris]
MESANLHRQQHHQLQENIVGSSSLAATTPSCYVVGTKHAWTPTTTLSSSGNSLSNSSLDPLNSSMVPDLGFHWRTNITSDHQSAHDLANIKEELSSSSSLDHHSSFPKLTEMLTAAVSSSSIDHDQYFQFMKNEQTDQMVMNDLSEKLLLKTLSSGCQMNSTFNAPRHHQISPSARDHHQFYSNDHHHLLHNSNLMGGVPPAMPSRSAGHFSQIYPSINVSNLNRSLSTLSTSSLDMNLQAMDLLGASARFSTGDGSSFSTQPNDSHDACGLYKERQKSFGTLEQMHQGKVSSFDNEITEVKRPGSLIEPKATQAAAPKKSRLESRTSCPPFKVRKEKLGDRIAALQQLVAPFGKTDTASVLMEAIGYIKFLQNQVETLSVPYMKSSRNKTSKTILQGGMAEINGNGETRDLRSRGLCLVPLSCMSYVTGDVRGGGGGCGDVWPTTNFGGGT